jgi:hypothetical protein
MTDWKLEDVEVANRVNPNGFFIPSLNERKSQKKGDMVRLHFMLSDPKEDEPRAERIWVEIIETKLFAKKYVGILTNKPAYIKSLSVGDRIEFEVRHIAQTIIKKNDPRWIDSGEKMALVSKMCMENGNIIRFLYREEPDNEQDSGWRMFTGLESDEYNSDSKNISLLNIYYLLDKDPTLLKPLKGDYGSAYERNEKDKPWRKVEDWSPPT